MEYIEFFVDSVIESFEKMFEEKIVLEKKLSAPACISSLGAAVVVGITGGKKGRVLLDMGLVTASKLAGKLDEELEDEDLSLFTIAEFCNIAAGGATTMLNNKYKGVGLRLSTPSIFAGSNSNIYSPKLNEVLLDFSTRFGNIRFYIGFEGEWE